MKELTLPKANLSNLITATAHRFSVKSIILPIFFLLPHFLRKDRSSHSCHILAQTSEPSPTSLNSRISSAKSSNKSAIVLHQLSNSEVPKTEQRRNKPSSGSDSAANTISSGRLCAQYLSTASCRHINLANSITVTGL